MNQNCKLCGGIGHTIGRCVWEKTKSFSGCIVEIFSSNIILWGNICSSCGETGHTYHNCRHERQCNKCYKLHSGVCPEELFVECKKCGTKGNHMTRNHDKFSRDECLRDHNYNVGTLDEGDCDAIYWRIKYGNPKKE